MAGQEGMHPDQQGVSDKIVKTGEVVALCHWWADGDVYSFLTASASRIFPSFG